MIPSAVSGPRRMNEAVRQAAAVLRDGGLVAIPTETVYGLAADATNAQAIARVFALKGRPPTHPVIVHIANAAALSEWAIDIPPAAMRLAQAFWPGPLTLILKRQPWVLDVVTGGQDSIGLRVPAHPLTLALLAEFGGAVAAPSANRYGHISATSAAHVREEFADAVDVILDGGPCQVGIESSIVSCLGPRPMLLRPGAITPSAMAEVLGEPVVLPQGVLPPGQASMPRVPGSHAAHYAPRTAAQCVSSEALQSLTERLAASGRVALLHYSPVPPALRERVMARQLPERAADYAQQLYAALRWADSLGVTQILIEAPPADEAWLAITDRLRRATASKSVADP